LKVFDCKILLGSLEFLS